LDLSIVSNERMHCSVEHHDVRLIYGIYCIDRKTLEAWRSLSSLQRRRACILCSSENVGFIPKHTQYQNGINNWRKNLSIFFTPCQGVHRCKPQEFTITSAVFSEDGKKG